MAPLLDGLLDPEHDLRLISLALSSPSHAALAHQALLRPPSLSADAYLTLSPLPPSPAPPASPAAASASLAHLHISLGKPCLLVPPLRIPWASSLSSALRVQLGVTLQVVRARSARPVALLASLARREHIPPPAAAALYAPLSPADAAYNRVVLAHLRARAPPRALDRLATAVKLAFAHALLRVLRADARLLLPPDPRPLLPPDAPAHPAAPPRPRPAPGPLVRDAWRVPRAHHAPRRPRVGVRATGSWARDAHGRPYAFLLHGVAIPARLADSVAALLAHRYAVHVDVRRDRAPDPHPGALLGLANSGTALLRAARGADRCRLPAQRRAPHPRPARVENVHAYLARSFGLRWPDTCADLVRAAEAAADKECADARPTVVHAHADAIREAEDIRAALVRRAVLHETAGTSLVRMCAFAMAQKTGGADVDKELGGFPDEYREALREAKFTMQQLEAGCAVPLRPVGRGDRNGKR